MAELLAPVVLWIDEIDKAFSNVGVQDSGVSARVFGYLLTWLSEKQDSVFVVATANEVDTLLQHFPEFFRKGRFDEIFYLLLPGYEARREIFKIYLRDLESLLPTADELEKQISELEKKLDMQTGRQASQQVVGQNATQGDDLLDRLASCLADDEISGSMTGAEIEYCLVELRTKLAAGQKERVTINELKEHVTNANNRALYNPNSTLGEQLDTFGKLARDNGWRIAEREHSQGSQE